MGRALCVCRIVLITLGLVATEGCIAYHVSAMKERTAEECVGVISSFVGERTVTDDYSGLKARTGADQTGFAHVVTLGSSISGNMRTTTWELRRHSYSDITDVQVQGGVIPFPFLWFIMDATAPSGVRLRLADGTSQWVSRRTTVWNFFPFYLVNPNWAESHRAARAFERLRPRQMPGSAQEP